MKDSLQLRAEARQNIEAVINLFLLRLSLWLLWPAGTAPAGRRAGAPAAEHPC